MILALQRTIARLLLAAASIWCVFGLSAELVAAYEASQAPSCCCKTEAARAKMACAKRAARQAPAHDAAQRADKDYKKCCGSADCSCGMDAGDAPGHHEGALSVTSSTVTFAVALPAKVDPHVRLPLVRGPDHAPYPDTSPPRALPRAQRQAHRSGPPPYLRLLVIRG